MLTKNKYHQSLIGINSSARFLTSISCLATPSLYLGTDQGVHAGWADYHLLQDNQQRPCAVLQHLVIVDLPLADQT